jgi:hypothetical protein
MTQEQRQGRVLSAVEQLRSSQGLSSAKCPENSA